MENNISFDGGFNVDDIIYNQNIDARVVPQGWYKLQLVEVGEIKPAKTGSCEGGNFKFEIIAGPLAGTEISFWFAVRSFTSKGAWGVNKFKAVFGRIAQTLGISRLTNVSQLERKPFFALIRQTTSTVAGLDPITGEETSELRYNNEFGTIPADSILSIEDYYRAFPPDNSNADAFVKLDANGVDSGGSDDGLAVKASRKKTAKKPAPEEDLPF